MMWRLPKSEAQQDFSIRNGTTALVLRLLRTTRRHVADQTRQKTSMEQALFCLLRMLRLLRGTRDSQAAACVASSREISGGMES